MGFIDYETAFDSVPTSAVIKTLRDHTVHKPDISLFRDMYEDVQCDEIKVGWNGHQHHG